MRTIDFSGTAAGARRVSQAILKLLSGSSGGTQRSSPNVIRIKSHGIVPERRKPRVNRPRSVPARECDPESVAFANSFVRLFKNEVSGVSGEIFGSNDVRVSFHRQGL